MMKAYSRGTEHYIRKEIGGYFQMEQYGGAFLHDDAILLNSGRACLELLIDALHINRIWLPFYLCDAVDRTCRKKQVEVCNYHIDATFNPIDIEAEDSDWVYIVNYYGQMSASALRSLKTKFGNVICDNAQAFFYSGRRYAHVLYL